MNFDSGEIGGNTSNEFGSGQKVQKRKEKRSKEKKRKKDKKRKRRRISSSEVEICKKSKTKEMEKSKTEKPNQNGVPSIKNEDVEVPGPSVPPELLVKQAKSRAPMTKEEWEKSQNVIRKVYDEVTGRSRLIRGDNEVLEEIVSRDRHRNINKQATQGDGAYFQNKLRNDQKT